MASILFFLRKWIYLQTNSNRLISEYESIMPFKVFSTSLDIMR